MMFWKQFTFTVASALALASVSPAQTPVVSSVVNAASLIPPPAIGHALVRGSLATIFGQNLATTTVTGSPPYGPSLGGTSVTVGSLAAPLLYVSPTQINFQVPSNLPLSPQVPYPQALLVVQTAAGASVPFVVDFYGYGMGIFTLDGSGCGRAAILNVQPDGSVSLNSPDNSAAPGDYLEIFGTGLGGTKLQLPDGVPAPPVPDPIDTNMLPIYVGGIGLSLADVTNNTNTTYAGRAPGLVGVYQVNVRIPQNPKEGCDVPLSITTNVVGITSQLVPVSIHIGGGACVDPPVQGSGQIVLQRTVFMSSSQPEADTMTASFVTAPAGSKAPTGIRTIPSGPGWGPENRQDPAAACGTPGVQPLSVGTMAVQGSFGSAQATTTSSKQSLLYTATLPAGAIVPGTYTISAAGAGGVGPLQVSLSTGQPIQPTVQFPQTIYPSSMPRFTVNWTGGDASETVWVKIVQHNPDGLTDKVIQSMASAVDHTMTIAVGIPISSHGQVTYLPYFSGELEVIIDVVPASPLPPFTAPGLTGGVTATWVYEYRFTGMMP